MKKLILPKIIILLCFILFVPFCFDKVYAQDKEPLNCEQLIKIIGSEKCAPWVMTDYSVWCAQTEGELLRYYTDEYGNPGMEHLYRNRAPDYTVDRSITLEELNACGANSAEGQVGNAKGNSQNSETGQSAKQNKFSKDGNLFNIFGANPFQTWLNLKGLSEIAAYIGTDAVIKDTGYLFSSIERAQQKQEAESNELFEEIKFVQEASARFGGLRSQDKIRAGEIVKKYDTRVEANNQPVLIKMGSGTLELHPLNGQTGIIEPGSWPMLKSGALDVIVEPQNGQQFEVQTPNMDLFVIGTEFSVIYDPKKDQTLIAVYRGQVEVKTKTGQKTIVSPKDDKPGVVLVSQKLSVWKLVLTGLVFTAIIGGAIFFLKRRGKKISSFKKKK